MRYVRLLAFADLFQIHLWVALGVGIFLWRRWRKTWAAVGVATALYCTATAVLSLIGWTPSGYLVVLLGATAAGWPSPADISRVRIYSLGIASVFATLCLLPTVTAWLLRRRQRDRL